MTKEREIEVNENKIKELAERVFNLLEPWERIDTSVEETANCIRENPLAAIEFLLDLAENQ